MLILGLLLAAAALVVFGYMLFGTRDLDPLQIDLGVFAVKLTPMHLYLLGAATLVVLVLGLFFLTLGLRAQRRRRREVKELRAAVHQGDTAPPATHARDTRGPRGHRPQTTAEPTPGTDPNRSGHDRTAPDRPVPGQPPAGPASYEHDVRGGPADPAAAPPDSPGRGQDVSLPSDYPRPSRGPDDRA